MRRNRSAKIIATLGPATSTEAEIAALFEAGADVFRMNFSHGSHQDHRARLEMIRRLEEEYRHPIGILLDLQGPKLRLGNFENDRVHIDEGQAFRLELNGALGTAERAPLPHPEVFKALEPGVNLLLDDGKVRLRVTACGKDFADTVVITGGELSNHKGVNVPSAVLDLSPMTDKDRKDLDFGLSIGVDWVALSFVQSPDDVAELRKIVGGRAGIMSKLEKPSAIDHLDDIVVLSDALMVARGDLGVELAPEDVPVVQKQIIEKCRHHGKPVVVATQMLDSMVHAPTPTRAEATDVANAIYEGADAVMLSAETAVGEYPVEAVKIMDRIMHRVEQDPTYRRGLDAVSREPRATSEDAISQAAKTVAHTISAAAIVTFTATGSTTLRSARERPPVPILGCTPNPRTARKLALVWGVHSVMTKDLTSFRQMVEKGIRIAKAEGFGQPGERLVITAGVPFGTPGATNILRIAWIE